MVSDGSDGAFHAGTSVTFDLNTRSDGIYNFTTITIDAGVIVRFIRNSTTNTPVVFLATGDVVINGTITVSASAFELGSQTGGPGGADGGPPGLAAGGGSTGSGLSPGLGGAAGTPNPGHAGGGGGMGTAGAEAIRYSAAPPAAGGGAIAYPAVLVGGSGGGGGGGWSLFGVPLDGGIGGGGGGAISIVTPGTITVGLTGQILANGAWGGTAFANIFGNGGPGGGGSGGVIELNSNVVTLSLGALLQAKGGPGGGISTVSIFSPTFSSGADGGLGFARLFGSKLHLDGTIDAATSLSGAATRLDHFLCYQARTTPKTPAFAGVSGVHLVDEFEDKDFDVQRVDQLCNPADKNGEGISDTDTHLEGYQIKEAKGTAKHEPQVGLKVLNQFHPRGQELVVDTVRVGQLLVPTATDLNGPVAAPISANHDVDHFKCYAVKISKGTSFAPILDVSIADAFIADPKGYDLKKPTRFCAPVDKEGEGVKNSTLHLQCYQVQLVKGFCSGIAPSNAGGVCARELDCGGTKGVTSYCELQPRHERIGVYANNQFGPSRIDAVKEEELCVPSARIVP